MKCPAGACRAKKTLRMRMGALVFLAILCIRVAHSSDTNPALEQAHRQFEAGQYREAAATLSAALEQNAANASLHHWLARCYFELDDFDRAISSAERSVQLDPRNSEYHLWLGRAYGNKAERAGWFSGLSLAKKSRREFEEAARLNPSNLPAQRDLIEFYFRAPGIAGGGDDKAQRQIEALAALDPVQGHLARGAFWTEKKKPQEAEQEYRQVLAASPKRVDPYLEVADFYMERQQAAKMEEAVAAAIRADPSDRRLSYYRGVARILAGNRFGEAEQCLQTYLATVPQRSDLPSHADAHEWLGRLYERQEKCVAAAEQYRQTLEIDPRRKSAREALRRAQKCSEERRVPPGTAENS